MQEIYTPQEAADKLKVNYRTLLKWLQTGKLKGVKLGHKTWRIPEESLEQLTQGSEAK
jgi:excisionase family DNA binding protein